jgi:hypothetical protein
MESIEIVQLLPGLSAGFEITSPTDEEYNCIAWTVNDTRQSWWPTPLGQGKWPGKYWPPGIPHEETVLAFTKTYKALGFQECRERTFESGFDKIAIYADNQGTVTHAARWWLEDSGWSSKLGEENDILHHSLESIEGSMYGTVAKIMKRPRTSRIS